MSCFQRYKDQAPDKFLAALEVVGAAWQSQSFFNLKPIFFCRIFIIIFKVIFSTFVVVKIFSQIHDLLKPFVPWIFLLAAIFNFSEPRWRPGLVYWITSQVMYCYYFHMLIHEVQLYFSREIRVGGGGEDVQIFMFLI